jgi:hypothetical protein
MVVYNFYIFNRDGQCIYYKEWNRTKQSGLSLEQEFKQMFGLIVEIKAFVTKISPSDLYIKGKLINCLKGLAIFQNRKIYDPEPFFVNFNKVSFFQK